MLFNNTSMQYNHGILSLNLQGMPSVRLCGSIMADRNFKNNCAMEWSIQEIFWNDTTRQIAFKSSQIPKLQE